MVEIYDSLAPVYDKKYSTDDCQRENQEIRAMIDYRGGKVLDIGCGTGLFLELFNIEQNEYIGIDPSGKMLEAAHAKFPGHIFLVTDFEEFPCRGKYFDYAICLFGVASYIKPERMGMILSHLKPGGRYFLMFYKPGYTPDYYNGSDDGIYRGNENLIAGEVIEYHNYIIKAGKNA
jgi:ubiquinone/menaquinone biosynthesis C-methylase UbiE